MSHILPYEGGIEKGAKFRDPCVTQASFSIKLDYFRRRVRGAICEGLFPIILGGSR